MLWAMIGLLSTISDLCPTAVCFGEGAHTSLSILDILFNVLTVLTTINNFLLPHRFAQTYPISQEELRDVMLKDLLRVNAHHTMR